MKVLRVLLMVVGLWGWEVRGFVHQQSAVGEVLRWALDPVDERVDGNVVNRSTRAVRYFLGAEGWSATNRVGELDALRAAFGVWQSVPGTGVRFEEGGVMVGAVGVNTEDNTNVVYWAKGSTVVNGGFDDIHGRLGVTFYSVFEGEVMAEADIVLNGVDYRWFTDFSVERGRDEVVFVEGVVRHEVGHFLGLSHSPVGGAAMMWRGLLGVGLRMGLSADEVAAARFLYPGVGMGGVLGGVKGRVTMGGGGVFGAGVIAEDLHGNVVGGTVSRGGGEYELGGMEPGGYRVRVVPLDGAFDSVFLVRPQDIASEYVQAETGFLATTNRGVVVEAGRRSLLDFGVVSGRVGMRPGFMRVPSAVRAGFDYVAAPVTVGVGSTNMVVGVLGVDLPVGGAVLSVSGDGIFVGPTFFETTATGLRGVFAAVTVAGDAVPGLRSFRLESGAGVVYVNGFLEVAGAGADQNFDGLDDVYQRRYFRPFTRVEAGPGRDPDGDGFSNLQEWEVGTDPTDRGSVGFRVISVVRGGGGAVVRWQAAAGRRFQLYGRDDFGGAGWVAIGGPVVAAGVVAEQVDPAVGRLHRFYRVSLLP